MLIWGLQFGRGEIIWSLKFGEGEISLGSDISVIIQAIFLVSSFFFETGQLIIRGL